MEYSIIIPTCDRNDLLRNCLKLLDPLFQTTTKEYEVIITDDGKFNQARTLICEEFSWAKWIEGPKRGPAANRNNGAKNASGTWLIFIDDDCLPDKNLILEFDCEARSNADLAVMEGYIDADRPKERLDEDSPINKTGDVLWSCNFAIKKQQFDHIGGFDENFLYATMEDVDLYTRLSNAGVAIKFVSTAIVIHPWRRRAPFKNVRKRIKSHIYFARKYKISGTFKYRWNRITTFARVFISNSKELISYSMKGWTTLIENSVSNFILIFI
jgi:GT2 family glycosyltransferase